MPSFAKPGRATHRPPMASRPIRHQTETAARVGNQAVLRRLSQISPQLQAKLEIGSAIDPLEREADHVASEVMAMREPHSSLTGASPRLSRKCAACEEEEERKLQRQPDGAAPNVVGDAPVSVRQTLLSPGRRLDAETRSFFEPRFGADFSSVRVHVPRRREADRGRSKQQSGGIENMRALAQKMASYAAAKAAPARSVRSSDRGARPGNQALLRHLSLARGPVQVGRKCAACEAEGREPALRRQPAAPHVVAAGAAPLIVHDVVRQPGRPLDAATRSFFEPRFGLDLATVRVHHDDGAADAAQSVGARAFTVGENIVFARGEFAPASTHGRHLLAHELAHVAQQRLGTAIGRLQRQPPNASVIPDKICDTPKGPGKQPDAISKDLLDRMMGKFAAKDGDPGEGCIPTPYPAGNGETVCTIGFGHQIKDCPTLSKATGSPPTAAEVADANTVKPRDGDKADAKSRKLRPSEWLTCKCQGKVFDCKGSEAENQLKADASGKAQYIHQVVPVDLDQAQFDALVDLALHHGSLDNSLLDAIKRYWCTAEGRNYVRELYLQTNVTAPGSKDVVKGFVTRRQLRVWPVEA